MNKYTLALLLVILTVVLMPTMAQETTECEEGFRLFDHEMLAGDPVCIPENPQRVLALEIASLETVLYTDKELVGTASWLHDEVPILLPELASAFEDVANTGYPANLEVALEAAPDIILATDGDIDVEAGAAIAPLVMVQPDYDWKLMMEFWSEVLGTEDVYEEMLTNYETRIAEFQAAMGDADPAISVISQSTYGVSMWMKDSAPGYVLADAGVTRSEAQSLSIEESQELYDADRWISVSEERFDLVDADAIFVFSYATSDPETREKEDASMEAFKANAVWNSLSAVQADNAYFVGPYWWRAQTYLLANKVLDDLFTYLTDTSATTPVLSIASADEATASIECEAGLRGVVDAVGTSLCLPEQPERVVSLTDSDTDALVALGVEAVGYSNGRGAEAPPRYLLESLPEDYVSVGTFFSPSLEVVLGLEPDVILFANGNRADEEVLAQLNAIAPVYISAGNDDTWRDHFNNVGDALNMTDAVDAFLADYDSRVAEIGAGIEPDTQAIVARWAAEGPQVMAPHIFAPLVLQEVGFAMPDEIPDLQAGHPHSAPLSLEAVDILDVDWAFVGTLQAEGDAVEALEAVFDNPLFQQLSVVQNDHVVVIDGSVWTSTGGAVAANIVLDDIEEALAGGE